MAEATNEDVAAVVARAEGVDRMQHSRGVIAILIVSYRTPADVLRCLRALDLAAGNEEWRIYICENGGSDAWESLCSAVTSHQGPAKEVSPQRIWVSPRLRRVSEVRLHQSRRVVAIAEAGENLGYAGGINAWLETLQNRERWLGCWILNPDALPEPGALTALIRASRDRHLGLTGSRLSDVTTSSTKGLLGLRWDRVAARTAAVIVSSKSRSQRGHDIYEKSLTAPSGASVYVTMSCLDDLLPLDERYFLYFEDLDWGISALTRGHRIGATPASNVHHEGGGSTGAKADGHTGSPLSTYLQFRNRILFVQKHYPVWLRWTIFMSWLHALRLVPAGLFRFASAGIRAGTDGETGRPEHLVQQHAITPVRDRASESLVMNMMRKTELVEQHAGQQAKLGSQPLI